MTASPKKKHTRARRGNKRSHKGLSNINGHRYIQLKQEALGLGGQTEKATEESTEPTES